MNRYKFTSKNEEIIVSITAHDIRDALQRIDSLAPGYSHDFDLTGVNGMNIDKMSEILPEQLMSIDELLDTIDEESDPFRKSAPYFMGMYATVERIRKNLNIPRKNRSEN